MQQCIDCGRGFHMLCRKGGCDNCHPSPVDAGSASLQTLEGSPAEVEGGNPESDETGDGRANKRKSRKGQKLDPDRPRTSDRKKNDLTLVDPKSTGRKRAVSMHGHADPTQPCEWRDKANCGGGRFPILGCIDGVQQSLHHGPDKNTLNNDRLNIHKICYKCHNRWHTLNDPDYDPTAHHEAHSPREPEMADLKEDTRRWAHTQVRRAKH